MGSNRPAKLAGTLKKRISRIIQTELRDPRIGFVTITNVDVTPDLRYVRVYFSVLGDEKAKKSAVIGLERAAGYIRQLIAKDIQLRFAPDIVFKYDETFEQQQRIGELLERIKREDEQRAKKRNKGDKEA
jgi:ribosome-binding factor A